MEETDQDIQSENNNTNAKIMAGLYAIAVLLFCFLGLFLIGFAGTEGERHGISAARKLAGPASFATAGFVTSIASIFFLKGRQHLQIIAPLFLSLVFGSFGSVTMSIFFETFWRML